MTKNKLAYSLIAVLAIGITSASFAVAEPTQDKLIKSGVTSTGGIMVGNPIPDIKGSIDVGKNVLSGVKVDFAEAAALAETEGKGTVINGNLGVQSGYLVYTFSIMSGNEMKIMIIDAGNSKILHTSEPMPADASSFLLSGHGTMFFGPIVPTAIEFHSDGNPTFEEQK